MNPRIRMSPISTSVWTRASSCSRVSSTISPVSLTRVRIMAGEMVELTREQLLALVDRKSTRLNSSHQIISYAVFCLKKKTNIASGKRAAHQQSIHHSEPLAQTPPRLQPPSSILHLHTITSPHFYHHCQYTTVLDHSS